MQTIKILKIDRASGYKDNQPWTRTDVTWLNNKTNKEMISSTFEGGELQINDVIDAEIVVSGQYSKIKSFRKAGVTPPAQTPSQPSRTQKEAPQPQKQYKSLPPQPNAPISGAEKGMIIGKSIDCFCAGLFTIGTQPELWEYIKGEISRVTGRQVN